MDKKSLDMIAALREEVMRLISAIENGAEKIEDSKLRARMRLAAKEGRDALDTKRCGHSAAKDYKDKIERNLTQVFEVGAKARREGKDRDDDCPFYGSRAYYLKLRNAWQAGWDSIDD